ncbi:hypothetical protein [Streptomyces sp. NPDC050263]|uniref:hypothetical protein n=1 Tax=Streptomyces sp. NPDC050263 TaxID=3155037 RepID=UPI003446C1E5
MGDNPARLNTEASSAALCGASPIEYSSVAGGARAGSTMAATASRGIAPAGTCVDGDLIQRRRAGLLRLGAVVQMFR